MSASGESNTNIAGSSGGGGGDAIRGQPHGGSDDGGGGGQGNCALGRTATEITLNSLSFLRYIII